MTIIMTMNIYINVDNLKRLSKEQNKSGLINDLLDKHYNHKSTFPAVQLNDNKVFMDESDTPESAFSHLQNEFERNRKICKHGADPKLCKFAKPGKPCK